MRHLQSCKLNRELIMLITKVDLYLPISQQVLHQIIDGGADNLEKVISNLDVPQIASLLLLQNLPTMKDKQAFECILAKIIDVWSSQLKKDGLSHVRAEVVSVLNCKNIEEGYKLLPDFRMALLDEEVIRNQNYLTFEGEWDYTFNERHREKLMQSLVRVNKDIPLTLEQSRIYQEIKAQTDDHIHVQGYAGTGKSFLIKSLVSMLDRKGVGILILAERQKQIEAIMSGVGQMDHVFATTFAGLAYEIIPQDLTNHINWNMRKKNLSRAAMTDDEVIRHFNIMPSDKFSKYEIVKAVRSTLVGFCYSGDENIQLSHIPKWCSSLNEVTKQVVLHFAVELWKEILIPTSKDFKPPVRSYHRIKWAALNRWQIPDRYTHILIDECHDLAKPMLQILDCSPQAVISLGDEYQNLQGRPQQRANIIRHREVTHSVRSGHLIENIVNPIIAIHPGKTKDYFHGNQLNRLDITYYAKPQVPDKPAVILVSDMWGLFEWAQRIASKNLNLSLLTDIGNLNMFVNDCIELYRCGTRPRHGELFRFEDWNEVARCYHNNQTFQQIDRMLRNGYQHKD
jgi:hypothetical protein